MKSVHARSLRCRGREDGGGKGGGRLSTRNTPASYSHSQLPSVATLQLTFQSAYNSELHRPGLGNSTTSRFGPKGRWGELVARAVAPFYASQIPLLHPVKPYLLFDTDSDAPSTRTSPRNTLAERSEEHDHVRLGIPSNRCKFTLVTCSVRHASLTAILGISELLWQERGRTGGRRSLDRFGEWYGLRGTMDDGETRTRGGLCHVLEKRRRFGQEDLGIDKGQTVVPTLATRFGGRPRQLAAPSPRMPSTPGFCPNPVSHSIDCVFDLDFIAIIILRRSDNPVLTRQPRILTRHQQHYNTPRLRIGNFRFLDLPCFLYASCYSWDFSRAVKSCTQNRIRYHQNRSQLVPQLTADGPVHHHQR